MEYEELFSAGEPCIQEEPVYCSQRCPVHVDVRTLMSLVQEGDFTGAYKLYKKQVVFPQILSRLCDEPCRTVCLRIEVDEAVCVRRIEKACADYAETEKPRQYAVRRKNGRVCVIGGGLSGLSCALNLARKGYPVTVYEKEERMGGRLWKTDSEVLPPDIITHELKQLINNEDLLTVCRQQVDSLTSVEGDAVYVATGTNGDTFGLLLGRDGRAVVDPVSLESSNKGVFAGGSLLNSGSRSAIQSVADGIRAARSIERFLKNASLTGERKEEKTRLVTKIPDTGKTVAVLPALPSGGYSREEAIKEAKRCYLCECKICVRSCEFLRHYGEYPRKYLSDILQTVKTLESMGGKAASRLISSCNLCGLCKEVCPTNLDMSDICVSSRRILQKNGDMPPVFYDFWLRDMQFSLSERSYLTSHPPGLKRSAYLFFPGCQMGASDPAYIKNSYHYLAGRLPGGVALTLSCCGAPAEWAGDEKLHGKMLAGLRDNWRQFGRPTVILACPSCAKMFSRYLPEIKVRTIWNVMRETGLPEEAVNGEGTTAAVYDPCSSRYDGETQNCIRELLAEAGYKIEELPYHGKYAQCCSYGGLINVVNPTLAEEIIQKRIAASPHKYVTYCTNCRDTFAANGKPTWHLLDLLFGKGTGEDAARLAPDLSRRRENRAELKRDLLMEIWGVDAKMEQQEYESINLVISDALRDKMNRQMLLLDDVKQVVYHAEKTGNRILDTKNGHFTAYYREGVITCWVEYLANAGLYEVINVYSHRLQIEESER